MIAFMLLVCLPHTPSLLDRTRCQRGTSFCHSCPLHMTYMHGRYSALGFGNSDQHTPLSCLCPPIHTVLTQHMGTSQPLRAMAGRKLRSNLPLTLFIHLLFTHHGKPGIMPPTPPPPPPPPPPPSLRPDWTPALAHRFLRHCHKAKHMSMALAPSVVELVGWILRVSVW